MSNKEIDIVLQRKAVEILDLIAEGADEQTACDKLGINRGQFVKWVIEYPEFEKAVNTAKEMRADVYKSKISSMVVDSDGCLIQHEKEDVPGVKANFEMLKWLASVDNPEKYGLKSKNGEGNVVPTQIIIDTGIKSDKPDVQVKTNKPEDLL